MSSVEQNTQATCSEGRKEECPEDYKQFTLFVRSGAEDFIEEVYKGRQQTKRPRTTLTDTWWKATHDHVMDMADNSGLNNYGILSWVIKAILAELPEGLFDEKQKKAFEKYITLAYSRYVALTKTKCYCGDGLCGGDCGVLACGCIDVCRCRCYRSWNKHGYDDWY
jgi:hypothetical protein